MIGQFDEISLVLTVLFQIEDFELFLLVFQKFQLRDHWIVNVRHYFVLLLIRVLIDESNI